MRRATPRPRPVPSLRRRSSRLAPEGWAGRKGLGGPAATAVGPSSPRARRRLVAPARHARSSRRGAGTNGARPALAMTWPTKRRRPMPST
ncbi:hypothetical protein N864_00890 [Intrasporangium chromatireducens Q5-1]|uniref:Uncharacterized protein n=1 Tax=Intrasporangium chromatireducens Q5-1 TaxID=584657 RepID=W9GQ81_9MICO|nr:hypothetical protein N864_00890 [Intrasporangium chromatireducens Q5-1]